MQFYAVQDLRNASALSWIQPRQKKKTFKFNYRKNDEQLTNQFLQKIEEVLQNVLFHFSEMQMTGSAKAEEIWSSKWIIQRQFCKLPV